MQRFVWDLMYPNPPSDSYDLPISAIYHDTPFVPQGPFVMPGNYTVKLTANGKSITKVLTVRMDPRVKLPPATLQQQFALSMQAYEGVRQSREITDDVKKVTDQLADRRTKAAANPDVIKDIDAFSQKLRPLTGGGGGGGQFGGGSGPISEMQLARLPGSFTSLLDLLQEADAAPTTQAVGAAKDLQTALTRSQKIWEDIKTKDLAALNTKLRAAGLDVIR